MLCEMNCELSSPSSRLVFSFDWTLENEYLTNVSASQPLYVVVIS